jgi:hypothetical protein
MRFPITELVLWQVILELLIYDVVALKIGQPTESMVLRDWARDWTVLPFIAGFLSAHWFAPRQNVSWSAWGFALPILGALLIGDLIWNLKFAQNPIPWWRFSFIYFALGTPVGCYLWGQPGAWSPLK